MRLRQGDKVRVMTGKDAGVEGRVARVINKKDKV
ncbi:MAG TPA: 50S ribosomal protein L24, partial [Actinobacteria bacterium]|nr:50S ribosomal protein L24 [Actinomycetota bacterium]